MTAPIIAELLKEWPYSRSLLEDVADDAGLDPDELREYLRAEIERVRRRGLPLPLDLR